jgi:hypothetical protein
LSFSPTTYSSPKPHIARMKSRLNTLSSTSSVQSTRTGIQPKRKIIRTLVMNCQSIKNKRCELQATTEYIKLDIIIGNESWLAPEYANSEIFPEGFNSMVYRNDRYKNCGGAFISVRDGYTTSEINQGSSN